jgi:hypothetical protein
MSTTHWRSAAEDETMQDEHRFVWKAMLDTIDIDLLTAPIGHGNASAVDAIR